MTEIKSCAAVLLLLCAGCQWDRVAERLDLGTPSEVRDVGHVERMTDGRRSVSGAPWNSDTAAVLERPSSFVLYDLGAVRPIEAAYLQGDNNDRFSIEVSEDGVTFTKLWVAGTRGGGGLRERWANDLDGRGRYVRVTGIGGDRWVSISELQLFSATPSIWPPRVPVRFEMTPSLLARFGLILFGVLGIAAAAFHRRGSRRSWVSWTLAGASAIVLLYAIVEAWPVDPDVINLSRAVAATVAAAVVLRLGLAPARAQSRPLVALLSFAALLSVATFYNFGHPQFYDGAQGKPTYVHTWDLRVYFPAVKYFDELGYDGVYLASVKSYADEELGGSLDGIGHIRLRDLRDYEMKRVSDLAEEIHAVRDRFTPERWDELTRDMAYFWKAMGKNAYLESLRDHGGNATPAWLLTAYLIYGSADATETTFLLAALLDPLLLLLFFGVAWRTFGLRTALVCLVAFGATTVYQFGSNWGGSTLRNDWMVLIGLGVCALKSRRLFVAGLLLGWAAMIRAFPALALIFLAAPIGWALVSRLRQGEGAPAIRELLPLARVAAGVLVVAIALGALSAGTFGWEKSWGGWAQKISMHANRPNVNHLGITALVSFDPDNLWHNLRARGEDPELWGPLTARTMKDRRWLILTGMLFYTLLAIAACRRLRLSDAAVIGTMMIPIYFYPSNYYLHILFIWPLMLAAWSGRNREAEWSLVAGVVLLACAIQWFGWMIPGNYGQFLFWSGVLLVAIALLLAIPIIGDRRASETA